MAFFTGCGEAEPADKANENKDVVVRYFDELLNQNKMEVAEEIVSPEIRFHRAKHKGDRKGMDDFMDYIELNNLQFPDLDFNIEDIIAEGDKIVVRFHATATYQQNGVKVESDGIRIFKLKDGKIVEIWEQIDDVQVMSKIDLITDLEYSYSTGYHLTSSEEEAYDYRATEDLTD